MWIRKSHAEIAEFEARRERKRKSILRPAVYGLLWASLTLFLYYLGFRGGSRYHISTGKFGQINLAAILVAAMCFAIVTAFVYRKQLRGEKFLSDSGETRLCNGCWQPSSDLECDYCGGTLEPYDYYTWREDEAEVRVAS